MFPSNFFYQPWIIGCHGADKHTTTFIDPMKRTLEEKNIVEIKGKLCFGCIDEWLFLWDNQSKECFFLDLNSLMKVHLPSLPKDPSLPREKIIYRNLRLSPSHNDPNCVVILYVVILDTEPFTVQERFFMCCQPHDARWNKIPIDIDQEIMGETSVILDGKMYTCSVDAVIVFDVMSLLAGQVDATTISTSKFDEFPVNDFVGRHLVESCGRIHLVRLHQNGQGPIDYIDIHCLDVFTQEWLRVDSIGERAFFLSNMSYVSVCATDVGVECNCIYYLSFNGGYEGRIYKFCLDDRTTTFSLTPTDETAREIRFCWFVPTRRPKRMIMGSSVPPTNAVLNKVNADKIVMENKITSVSRPWNDLPMDLVDLLVPNLSLVDALRFFTVCKSWNLASESINKAKTWPWLMYREKLDGTCKLLDPLNGKDYTTSIGSPSSIFPAQSQMLCSKDGWVIVLDAAGEIFMFNPLNKNVVKLPSLEERYTCFYGLTFTSVPTSPDCVVLGFFCYTNCIGFYKWCYGEEDWTMIYDDESPFQNAARTNPVFFQGEFYCLAENGELGVFNPVEETWRMLDKPKPLYYDQVPFRGTQDCYLIELDGNLIAVFKCNYSDNDVRIFKLDTEKMEWILVEDLAGWTLFVDPRGSFAKPSPHKSWSNKILFTAFCSSTIKTCATYYIESKKNMIFIFVIPRSRSIVFGLNQT